MTCSCVVALLFVSAPSRRGARVCHRVPGCCHDPGSRYTVVLTVSPSFSFTMLVKWRIARWYSLQFPCARPQPIRAGNAFCDKSCVLFDCSISELLKLDKVCQVCQLCLFTRFVTRFVIMWYVLDGKENRSSLPITCQYRYFVSYNVYICGCANTCV